MRSSLLIAAIPGGVPLRKPGPGDRHMRRRGHNSFTTTAQGQSVDGKPGTSILSYRVNVK